MHFIAWGVTSLNTHTPHTTRKVKIVTTKTHTPPTNNNSETNKEGSATGISVARRCCALSLVGTLGGCKGCFLGHVYFSTPPRTCLCNRTKTCPALDKDIPSGTCPHGGDCSAEFLVNDILCTFVCGQVTPSG